MSDIGQRTPVPTTIESMERRFTRILASHGLPRRLFPNHVERFEIDTTTGEFWGRFGVEHKLGVPSGLFCVSTRISGRFPDSHDPAPLGHIVNIQGMAVEREIFGLRTMVPVEAVRVTEDQLILTHGLGPETFLWDSVG